VKICFFLLYSSIRRLRDKEVIKNTYAFFITCEILIDKKQPTKILSRRLRVAEKFFPLSLNVNNWWEKI